MAPVGCPDQRLTVIAKDAAGQVVGLVFDGNLQSLGGDYGFDAAVNRAVSVHSAALLEALRSVGEGTTELMAHPGFRPSVARTSFGVEREVELAALTAPEARRAVEAGGITLCSYAGLPG